MAQVHPTAILEGDVHLADDVTVGPYCVLTGRVTIGAGCRLVANVHLHGPIELGADNVLYPGVCLGFAPQSLGYDRRKAGLGVVIGNGNTFREGVTVHRAMTEDGPTRLGNANYLMANAHIGHDCVVGSHVTFVNGVLLGGHCHVDDRVNLGGGAGIHQFVHIGEGAMISGGVELTMDVPPNLVVSGRNTCVGINRIGMRRRGLTLEQINTVRWVYRTLFRRGLTFPRALECLAEERGDDPLVAAYIEFCRASKRGIVTARSRRYAGPVGA